jgi:hypothetical protein
VLRPGLALVLVTACGGPQVHEPVHGGPVDSVSLSCVDASERMPHFVPCDGALPRAGAYVAVWFHGGTEAWLTDSEIALNDIEMDAKEEVTILDQVIPIFALADAFPDVRQGKQLPPARYHLRVAVVSYRGAQQMFEQDLVVK